MKHIKLFEGFIADIRTEIEKKQEETKAQIKQLEDSLSDIEEKTFDDSMSTFIPLFQELIDEYDISTEMNPYYTKVGTKRRGVDAIYFNMRSEGEYIDGDTEPLLDAKLYDILQRLNRKANQMGMTLLFDFYQNEKARGVDAFYFLRNNEVASSLITFEHLQAAVKRYKSILNRPTINIIELVLTDQVWG